MNKLILYIFIVVESIYGSVIDDKQFKQQITDFDLPNPLTIGNSVYKRIMKNDTSIQFSPERSFLRPVKVLTYPLTFDPPFGDILPEIIDVRYTTNKNSETDQIRQELQTIINNLLISKDEANFQIEAAISINSKKDIEEWQTIVMWSSTKTYLMLNFPNGGAKDMRFSLGRGIPKYDFSIDVPKSNKIDGRLIYEISSNVMIKIGCQPVQSDSRFRNPLQLTLSKYRLSSLGGEHLILQGPCVEDIYYAEFLKVEIQRKGSADMKSVDTIFNNNTNTFHITTPPFWYSGVYEFKIKFREVNFITNVDIYSYQNPNQKYELKWNESSQMNNPNFDKSYITLILPMPNPTIQNVMFQVFDFKSSDPKKAPSVWSKMIPMDSISINDSCLQISLQSIYDSQIDILNNIGFFGMNDTSSEIKWTEPFSLLWLTNISQTSFDNSICKNYILNSESDVSYFCPATSDKVIGLQSVFRKIDLNINLSTKEFKEYDCFTQILPGSASGQQKGRGVTCCYFKDSKHLVYGQDFYLRNGSSFGSYSWSVSPKIDFMKHFIHDRIPILSCCILIKNESLCTEYWNKRHQISIDYSTKRDLIGNVFGDPHFIPFVHTSNYSFLNLGQYDIITTNDNEFQLQGRFYYELRSDFRGSLLKAIAFKIPSGGIVITTSGNSITNLQWQILLKRSNSDSHESIIVLPFNDENLHIFQSEDTSRLHIYARIKDKAYIYLEFERFEYYYQLSEYIDMKIFLSNYFEATINGGLFGKVDNKIDSTSLYNRSSDNFLPADSLNDERKVYDFVLTWKFNQADSLFFDMDFVENSLSFKSFAYSNYAECGNVAMCDMDRSYHISDKIYNSTLGAYNSRKKLEIDWIAAFLSGNVCDHPKLKQIKLSSYNYAFGENITISGCLDPSFKMKNPNQLLICEKLQDGEMKWRRDPSFEGEFCEGSDTAINESNTVLYASVSGSIIVLVLVCIIISTMVILNRRRRLRSSSKATLGLSISSQMPVMEIYDNFEIENQIVDDEYQTYAEIQKTAKSTGV